MNKTTMFMIVAAILIIILLALMPIVSIWALNTLLVGALFVKPIELTIWTYLATLWFGLIIGGIGASSRN